MSSSAPPPFHTASNIFRITIVIAEVPAYEPTSRCDTLNEIQNLEPLRVRRTMNASPIWTPELSRIARHLTPRRRKR